MSDAPAGHANAQAVRTVQRGQIWETSDARRVLVIGLTTKTRQVVVYVYVENKSERLTESDLVTLLQDVCQPRIGQDRPAIKAVGKFCWDPQNGFQQLPKDFTSDTGATTLVRQEDAELAVNTALETRDAALAALHSLREAVAQFQRVLADTAGD